MNICMCTYVGAFVYRGVSTCQKILASSPLGLWRLRWFFIKFIKKSFGKTLLQPAVDLFEIRRVRPAWAGPWDWLLEVSSREGWRLEEPRLCLCVDAHARPELYDIPHRGQVSLCSASLLCICFLLDLQQGLEHLYMSSEVHLAAVEDTLLSAGMNLEFCRVSMEGCDRHLLRSLVCDRVLL